MRRGVRCGVLLFVSSFCSVAWAQVPPPNDAPGSPLPPPEPAPAEGEAPPVAPAPAAPAPPADGAPAAPPTDGAPAAPPTDGAPAAPPVEAPPAEPPPAAPPPAVAPAPVVIPPVMPAYPPAPMDTAPKKKVASPPPETTLGFELDLGLNGRLGGSSDYDLSRDESGGMVFGPGVWLAPSRLWSVGLVYERTGLGVDRSAPGENSVDVKRDLDALWVRGRAYPWRTDSLGVFVGLGMGVAWQHVRGTGTRDANSFVRPPKPYSCEGSDGPGFALGGGVGLDVDLSRSFAFITGLDASAHRQTGDVVESCAPGSGSITSLGARLGFAYRFDLEESSQSATSRRRRALARK